MLLLLQATQAADSVQVAADELIKEAIANADGKDKDRNQYTFSGTNTEVYQLLSNQRKFI